MEEDTTLGFSEYFAKIEEASLLQNTSNNSDTAHYDKNQRLHKDDKMTRKSLTNKRSFSLNKESISIPMRKTKSLSSHFLVDVDKLMNSVSESVDETGQTLNGSCENNDMAFLSICEAPLSSESSPDGIILKNLKSDISASVEADNTDSCSWRKLQIEPGIGIYLKFEDVNYSVRCKGKNSKVEKQILHGVSGSVSPGEILALMGPSGGGKTTLLNLLSGRMKHNGGSISYNDKLYTKSLKRRIGFVLQDDVVFPHLSVKETLTYSALLRLPNTLSRDEKKERAMNVISELGLEGCQDTMIGGKFVRGVSGGERKRVCIANEILLNPSLLFLDEPTSSLDSTTALRIVQMLRNIAKDGKTVVTTIHQPSSRLFSKFDTLILLSKGCSLYFGKASEAMMYFSSIGCSPLIAMNPAEFLIDLANGNMKEKSVPSKLEDKFLPCDVHEYLLGVYESRTSSAERIQIKRRNTPKHESERQYTYNAHEYGASWSEQFSILFTRGLKERRHEYLSSLRVIQVLSTAFIMGLLWWRSDASSNEKIQDQAGLLFFISIFWTFFPLFTAIFTFPQEREMLAKERSVDMYKLSAYLTARNISDLPLDLLLPVIFLAIVYLMTGLKPNFSAFWLTLCTIFLSIIASQGLGLTIGAALMDVKKATTLASITVMTFMLCGGFFIEKVPTLMSWIRYVSLNYHTYRLLLKIQYSCAGDPYGSGSVNCELHSNFLKSQRLDYGGIVEIGALLVMIIGYRLVTYILLRRMKLIVVT